MNLNNIGVLVYKVDVKENTLETIQTYSIKNCMLFCVTFVFLSIGV